MATDAEIGTKKRGNTVTMTEHLQRVDRWSED
jgi:hypothetical protein